MADISSFGTHWLGRWFGHPWRGAAVGDAGIALFSGEEPLKIGWQELSCPPRISTGITFDAVVLGVRGEVCKIDWLPGSTAQAFKRAIEQRWYRFHAAAARAAVERLRLRLDQSAYLRTSLWQRVKDEAAAALETVTVPPPPGAVPDEIRAPFLQLAQWADWDAGAIQPLREQYVTAQQEHYRSHFDSVESGPLTERQRDACIVDEDNNLVLAGAGTGKTSTLVGRAAYLVRSGQARADEILLLAFGNKAAQEMRERLARRLDGEAVRALTFHALGQQIITRVEGGTPSISPLAEDEKRLALQVDAWFQQLLEDADYRARALSYFQQYLHPEKPPFDFQSQGEYFAYLAANKIRTLKGEVVRSLEACLIANWLFRMGVEYAYAPPYQEARTAGPDFRAYRPEFYLPEYGIYIEHFGIDREGRTAPYIDREAYQAGMAWTRELHRTHQTRLIETYYFEQQERCLLQNLQARLAEYGVLFEPLPDEAVLETLRECGAISRFSELLSQLLGRYKANGFDDERLREQIASSSRPEQVELALALLHPIFEQYQALLASRGEIDFDDMIGRAIDYVQDGRFKPRWRFILVDEFQDIAEPRARLVRSLRDASHDCSLFCVGDDWQAIYRFAGSDLSLTTGFERYFGATAITILDKTFRFNNSICEVAARFVIQNPAQLKKQLGTQTQVHRPAVSLLRQSTDPGQPLRAIHQILSTIARRAEPGSRVYLLARFWFRLPKRHEVEVLNRAYPTLEIEALSVHAAKGKEADYVVIVGLEAGRYGFPSETDGHPVLDALLPSPEPCDFAEERRLFYVALTRARHRVYLTCDMTAASRFVVELLDGVYPIELNEFDT